MNKRINILSPPSCVDDILFDMTHSVLNQDYPEHKHTCIEIVIVMEGNGVHCFNDECKKCLPGNVFIVLPGNAHGFQKTNNLSLYNISCTPDIIDSFGLDSSFWNTCKMAFKEGRQNISLSFNGRKLLELRNLINCMFEEYSSNNMERHLRLRSFFALLFMMLAQEFAYAAPSSDNEYPLLKTVAFIESHYREKIALAQLAQIACLSQSQLLRRFRAEFKSTPIAYLLEFRLQKAARLLIETSMRINELAFSTGFRDCNYFIKQFKKRYKLSPVRFRKDSKN